MKNNLPSSSPDEPVLTVLSPPGCDAEWDWILSVILGDWLGIKYQRKERAGTQHVTLTLETQDSETKSLILGADLWLTQSARSEGFACPQEPLSKWTPEQPYLQNELVEANVPVLFGAAPGADLPIDIFGSAFWMLARIEEIIPGELDNFDRFPAWRSLACREEFVDRPIVDEYVALLRAAITARFSLRMQTSEFRMHVSHDVDVPNDFGFVKTSSWLKGVIRQIRRNRNFGIMLPAVRQLVRPPDRFEKEDTNNTFDYLMTQSEKRCLKSAFYFFGGRTEPSIDAEYNLSVPAIQNLLKEIHSRGHEIGLHPSFNTYLDPDTLASEAQALLQTCEQLGIQQSQWGGRMHILRWRWPDTARSWDDAGMAYDSTFGFADRAGFRCGTSHEYTAFDPVKREQLKLRLRPLVVMEVSVVAPRYMGLGYGQAAYDEIFKLKDRCRKYGGGFSLLWHNSHFHQPGDRSLYEAALDH